MIDEGSCGCGLRGDWWQQLPVLIIVFRFRAIGEKGVGKLFNYLKQPFFSCRGLNWSKTI